MITNPVQEKPETKRRQGILADPSLMAQVDEVGKELSFATRTKTLAFLTKFYEETQHRSDALPIATFDSIMKGAINQEAPIALCGIPGSGKSYTLDLFLRECQRRGLHFLLFSSRAKDSSKTEHSWVSNVLDFYKFVSLQWLENPGEYRIDLETDLNMRKQQMKGAAETLLRLEGDQRLATWIIAIEEGADFAEVRPFLTFLRRMRKSCRRIVVPSTEADLFKMCKPTRPIPFKEGV